MPNNQDPHKEIENKPNFVKTGDRRFLFAFIKYGVTTAVALGIFFATLGITNFFTSQLTPANYYRTLADAFTVPGMVLICLALLVFVSEKGAFTGLLYALRHVARMLLPFLIREDITYAEYLEAHNNRRGLHILLCFFIVGGLFLIGAVICIILYYQNA